MIQKKFSILNSYEVEIQVLGKAETENLFGFEKEDINFTIQKFVSDRFKISLDNAFILNQTHGDIFWNSETLNSRVLSDGDALYTTRTETVLIVKTADCMPIFFWSNQKPLIGVVHSGWKGTHLGISEKIFLYLKNQGYDLDSIQALLGPCARKKNYEVGEDLFGLFKNYFPECIEKNQNNKFDLGVDLVLKKRLLENSIPISLIDSEICTIENESYYSHRRKEVGRNLNLIILRKQNSLA